MFIFALKIKLPCFEIAVHLHLFSWLSLPSRYQRRYYHFDFVMICKLCRLDVRWIVFRSFAPVSKKSSIKVFFPLMDWYSPSYLVLFPLDTILQHCGLWFGFFSWMMTQLSLWCSCASTLLLTHFLPMFPFYTQ